MQEAAIVPAASPAQINTHTFSILAGAKAFRFGIYPQSPAPVESCHFVVEIIESKKDACGTATWHFGDVLALALNAIVRRLHRILLELRLPASLDVCVDPLSAANKASGQTLQFISPRLASRAWAPRARSRA